MSKTVCIVCFDHFTDIDTFLPWDMLNRVRLRDDDWAVKLIGDKTRHTSIAGLETPTHGGITDANAADAVLFTSGAKGTGRWSMTAPGWVRSTSTPAAR